MKQVVLCVPTDLSKGLSKYLTQKGFEIIRDIPHISRSSIMDFITLKPDIIIVSEYVAVDTGLNLVQALQLLKTQINVQVIVHLNERPPGDRLIHNLVSIAIYDFIASRNFNLSDVLALIENPRSFNDVAQHYLYFLDQSDTPLPVISVPQERVENSKGTQNASYEPKSSWRNSLNDLFKNIKEILPKSKEKNEEPQEAIHEEWKDRSSEITTTSSINVDQEMHDSQPEIKVQTPNINIIRSQSRSVVKPTLPPRQIKKVENPFARSEAINTREKKLSINLAAPQPEIPIPQLRMENSEKYPHHVLGVLGINRYVGTTTIGLNLLSGQSLYVLLRSDENLRQLTGVKITRLGKPEKLDALIQKKDYAQIIVDLGSIQDTSLQILPKFQRIIIVMDNRPKSLDEATQYLKLINDTQIVLAVNKAQPLELSPGKISQQLKIPLGIVLPFDSGYMNQYGLALPRGPWEALNRMIKA